MENNTSNTTELPLPKEKEIPTNRQPPQPIVTPQRGNKRGNKRGNPRRGNFSGLPDKRQKSEFIKQPETTLQTTYLLLSYFELATSFYGVRHVATSFYNVLRARDRKLTDLFSVDEFYYVILLSVYYRCATIANKAKGTLIFGMSDLKTATENLLLPDVIAKYIETYGMVKKSDGVTVYPYFRDIDNFDNAGFVNPGFVLDRINEQREAMNLQPYNRRGEWSISSELIVKYMTAVSRALKNAIELRTVTYSETEGRMEFLAVYETSDNGYLRCKALDKIDLAACQLGSAYRFHHPDFIRDFGVPFVPVYGAPDIDPDIELSAHFNASLRLLK